MVMNGGIAWRDKIPWIEDEIVPEMEKLYTPTARVFEYGCGASTVWATRRVAQVIAVEHWPDWYNKVRAFVDDEEPELWNRLTLMLIQERVAAGADPLRRLDVYARTIRMFPTEYFDVVMVDGRARRLSLLNSLDRVKHGGVIILDDTERDYYLCAVDTAVELGFTRWDVARTAFLRRL